MSAPLATLGAVEITALSDGRFKLDGGAMFGIIPRALWGPNAPPDPENRIELELRVLLLRVDQRLMLVDTGMGSKWSERDVERYQLVHHPGLLDALAAEGVAPEDLTDVVLTHLHFDHAGGATRRDGRGALVPTFPRARYHLQRRNLAHALRPTARDRGSYLEESFRALLGRPELVLHDGPVELAAGVDLLLFEGHTIGQQLLRVRDPRPGGAWLLYCADIIPSSAHLSPAAVMGYDLYPDVTAREKERILARAAAEGGTLVFEHDPRVAACKVKLDPRGRPQAVEVIPG